MKRKDGAYLTQSEMADIIEKQEKTITFLRVELDNWQERYRRLESAFEGAAERVEYEGLNGTSHDDLDDYSLGLPV